MKLKEGDIVRIVPAKQGRNVYHEYDMVIVESIIDNRYNPLSNTHEPHQLFLCEWVDDAGERHSETWHENLIYRTRKSIIQEILDS
jgi:hypothetical protein